MTSVAACRPSRVGRISPQVQRKEVSSRTDQSILGGRLFNWRRTRGWRMTRAFGHRSTSGVLGKGKIKFTQTGSHKASPITQLRISLQSSLLVLCQSQASDSTDKLQGIHSIRSPHPTNLFLSISPHFASPSPSLANPFTHNAFSSITTSLFDDEDTNNACSSSLSPLQVPAHSIFIQGHKECCCPRTGVASVQTKAFEVVDQA